MEGRERDNRVEVGDRRLPDLELRIDDLDIREARQVPARQSRKLRAELDADDLEPALGEGNRRLARAGADLEQPGALGEPCERHELLERRVRVGGPDAVVELGHLLERRTQALPLGEVHA